MKRRRKEFLEMKFGVSKVRRGGNEVNHKVGRTGIQETDKRKTAQVGGFGKVLP